MLWFNDIFGVYSDFVFFSCITIIPLSLLLFATIKYQKYYDSHAEERAIREAAKRREREEKKKKRASSGYYIPRNVEIMLNYIVAWFFH